MKKLFIPITVSFVIFGFSAGAQNPIKAKVSGTIFGSGEDSIFLAQNFGTHYVDYHATTFGDDGSFAMELELPNPDYYVLRFGDQYVNIIIRENSDIQVYGDGKRLDEFTNFINSQESQDMHIFTGMAEEWRIKRDSALVQMEQNPEKKDEINHRMSSEFNRFRSEHKAFIKQHPNSAALYPTLSQIDIKEEFETYESVVNQLAVSFSKSPTIQTLLKQLASEREKIEANNPLAIGKEAPDFEETKPDGSSMKLSDLRGSVVLLDFWASWCGPCRRENPMVVKLYEKYRSEGFTVMSVSLDKNKQSWLDAIEKDRLSWPNHVSDLASWSSKAAKLYGVSGIPFTVLIDREGKIIQTKLRGLALENKLVNIFGH